MRGSQQGSDQAIRFANVTLISCPVLIASQTRVIMTDCNNHRFEGTPTRAKGKTTTIGLRKGNVPSGNLRSVKVVGLPELTSSESARDELIHRVLVGQKSLQESSFIQMLWFPHEVGRPTTIAKADLPKEATSLKDLNNSQCTAMRAMVGNSPIVIVHGTFDLISAFKRLSMFF